MFNPRAVPRHLGRRRRRLKDLHAALWSYLRRSWMRASEEDSASVRIREIFQGPDRSNLDDIANEVYRLLQSVPDECQDPQLVVLELAKSVMDRTQGAVQGGRPASSTGSEPSSAAGATIIQNAFCELDPRTRAFMRLHLSDGNHYRAIAERLNMDPSHVLRIIGHGYVRLRWHTEPVSPGARMPPEIQAASSPLVD
jgi:hypothetical protein